MRSILIKPVITERSIKEVSNGVYTFMVALWSKKEQVKKAVEDIYNVHVEGITTSIMKGKKRLVGKRRMTVYEKDTKKARVRLKNKEKIDLFDVGGKT